MAISEMKKLTAVTMKHDSESLVRRLIWLSCVEVETVDADNDYISPYLLDHEYAETEQSLLKITNAITVLKKHKESSSGLFKRKPVVDKTRFENSENVCKAELITADKVDEVLFRQAHLKQQENKLLSQKISLQPWLSYDIPLNYYQMGSVKIMLGTLPLATDINTVLAEISADEVYIQEISSDVFVKYIMTVYHNSCEDDVLTGLARSNFIRLDNNLRENGFNSTAADIIRDIDNEVNNIKEENEKINLELKEFAKEFDKLELVHDIIQTKLVEIETRQKLLCTNNTVLLTGWVPLKLIPNVESELSRHDDCWFEFNAPEETDDVPVLLQNNKIMTPFEQVIKLYSLPAYGSFDPTFVMSIFYFIIFGLMFGDVIYGLLLIVGGSLMLKFMDVGKNTKQMVKMFAICGISSTVTGILFGSYFGDFPSVIMDAFFGKEINSPALLFDIVEEPMTFLILSLVMGAIHLLAGMGVKFYILCKQGKVFDAIFDIGSWFVLFAGIGLYIAVPSVGLYVLIAGLLMLILTQGRAAKNPIMKLFKGIASLYDIINYVADLISYSRIMALGLSSAVIASVVNILATLPGSSIIGIIAMILILVVGHGLNIAISLLSVFVHNARLQYIEFFGKFYEDGGRPFKPASPKTQYVHIAN